MIVSKVAKRYAKALLSLGREDGNFERYGRDLQDFSEFCLGNREFRKVIANQIFAGEDRKKILNVVLEESGFSDVVKNFLNLLLDKYRIGAVEEITKHYERLTDEISNIARAEIITPMPLKEEAQNRLEKVLGDLTSKKIKTEVKEDESLIGGIIVKIGDLVLDGSMKAQLEGLKESLKRGEYS
ncbi:MAG: ATP synthase F1 subunit delta [Deltaproteobacteria bacterium]|nr:MAG: ATP synthase F1 subunit delta [Deltaproteobacteria bacterium]